MIENNPATPSRIGPNALIQTVRATREISGEEQLRAVLQQCHQESLLQNEPEEMVDEQLFADLVMALDTVLGADTARTVLDRSGHFTAEYLLENRIPGMFQQLLRVLPDPLALRALLFAISQSAWTFTGSGKFDYHIGAPATLTVIHRIKPGDVACAFYGGTFNHLLHTLLDRRTQFKIATTDAQGVTHCRYVVQSKNYS
jgi:divinyl protochlorophyllide a 8-vinyl-reductase